MTTALAHPMHTAAELPYPDVNAFPWPLNHHAYIHACADELMALPDVTDTPLVEIPVVQSQRWDVRTARVSLQFADTDVDLAWDELTGWVWHATEIIHGAGPLLAPHLLPKAVRDRVDDGPVMASLADGRRLRAHPLDLRVERRLAAYRLDPS